VLYFDVTPTEQLGYVAKLRQQLIARVLLVANVVIVLWLVIIVGMMVKELDQSNPGYKSFAYGLGIVASIIVAVVWTPQIWTTWRRKVLWNEKWFELAVV
jgi:hypothetical protein